MPLPTQSNLVWEAGRRELGMDVGPQGRLAQAYEGLVWMDFRREFMEERGCGVYERLAPELALQLKGYLLTRLAVRSQR